jgi:hypothetical protein
MTTFLPDVPDCIPSNPLAAFLLGPGKWLRPQSPPWIRLFRIAGDVPWNVNWLYCPLACDGCAAHVTFQANTYPRPQVIARCLLCLACGRTSVEYLRPGTTLHETPVVGDGHRPARRLPAFAKPSSAPSGLTSSSVTLIDGRAVPLIALPSTVDQRRGKVRRSRRLDADLLTAKEIERLLRACSHRAPTGVRNRAMIAIAWRSGLRIGEGRRTLILTPARSSSSTARATNAESWASMSEPPRSLLAGSRYDGREGSTAVPLSSARYKVATSTKATSAIYCHDSRARRRSISEFTPTACATLLPSSSSVKGRP